MAFDDEPLAAIKARESTAYIAIKAHEKDLLSTEEARGALGAIYPEFFPDVAPAPAHYTSKPWHVIPSGGGKFVIKCDTSYATAGLMEFLFDPTNSQSEYASE